MSLHLEDQDAPALRDVPAMRFTRDGKLRYREQRRFTKALEAALAPYLLHQSETNSTWKNVPTRGSVLVPDTTVQPSADYLWKPSSDLGNLEMRLRAIGSSSGVGHLVQLTDANDQVLAEAGAPAATPGAKFGFAGVGMRLLANYLGAELRNYALAAANGQHDPHPLHVRRGGDAFDAPVRPGHLTNVQDASNGQSVMAHPIHGTPPTPQGGSWFARFFSSRIAGRRPADPGIRG
jgi:hypothetical protein